MLVKPFGPVHAYVIVLVPVAVAVRVRVLPLHNGEFAVMATVGVGFTTTVTGVAGDVHPFTLTVTK